MTTQPPSPSSIKITFLAYKLPSVSTEEFTRRWISHGHETARILQKHNCLEYTQQHSSPSSIQKLRSIITPNAGRALVGDDGDAVADGVATMVFRDWESAEGFFRDEENVVQARRDTPGFTDYARRKMIVGNEVVFFRKGDENEKKEGLNSKQET